MKQNIQNRLFLISLIILSTFLFSFLSTNDGYAAEIAVIKSKDIASYNQALEGFRAVSSANLKVYDMKGDLMEGYRIIDEIRSEKPDMILTIGVKAARVVKEKVGDIPVVFCMVMNPEKYGIKGPNITGVSLKISAKKQFDNAKLVIPGIGRIGVIYDPQKTGGIIEEAVRIAKGSGLDLVAYKVNSEKEVARALRDIINRVDALWMIADPTVVTKDSFRYILITLFDNNIPLISFSERSVEAGALLSLEPDYKVIGQQTGMLANRIIEGANPQNLPIESPKRFRLSINLNIAQKIGLKIPSEVINTTAKVYR